LPIGLASAVVFLFASILLISFFVFKKQRTKTVEILVSEGKPVRGDRGFSSISFQDFEVEYGRDSDFEFAAEKRNDDESLLRGSNHL
jgi:hypothetical protein